MMQQIRWMRDTLFDETPGRCLDVLPDDVFLVSYPRSGNTWIRFLVGNLIDQNAPTTFRNIEQKIPDIYKQNKSSFKRLPSPRYVKSHEYFDPRYKKVIYVVRDPRDVAVSYYHFLQKIRIIDGSVSMDAFVPRFLVGDLDPFSSWGEHVGSWLGARKNNSGFLLLHYETMLEQPHDCLRQIATLLAISASDEIIARAVQLSSAELMRQYEREQADIWKTTQNSRKDIPFVRNARAGSWKSELPMSLAARIEDAWKEQMKLLGYV